MTTNARRMISAAADKRRGVLVAVVALLVSSLPAVAIASPPATGTEPATALWTASSTEPSASRAGHARSVNPRDYRAYTLDAELLDAVLDEAPEEGSRAARTGGSVDLVVPAPTGELVHFAVVSSPIMEDELAAAHPDIRTYAGTSVTEGYPASIRLDVTRQGFHAAVRGGQASWYVDPAHLGDDSLYLSYFGSALPAPERGLIEPQLDRETHEQITEDAQGVGEGVGAAVKQRVYRLALLTDPSYAEYVAPGLNDGTQDVASNAAVLDAKVTLINRVNEIYNDDLAIKLVLINGTDDLNLNTVAKVSGQSGPCGSAACFIATGDGSLPEGCSSALLTRQRSVIGLLAGAGNFDIGHLMLGLDGGGLAALGVVGRSDKARGCTGLGTPTGDFMAIDYVAHEMGHQFDANHTFNGVAESCAGANRNEANAVEPGSGSSVMAYAGICDVDDLQSHTDPYFSQRSQTEISEYVNAASVPTSEVQAVALTDFDGAESFTLTFGGLTTAPITFGDNYNAAGIRTAVAAVTGGTVNVGTVHGTQGAVTSAGFQLGFAGGSCGTCLGGPAKNVPNAVLNAGAGFSGFTSEIIRGGPDARGGNAVETRSNHHPVVTAPARTSIPTRTPFTLTGSAQDADGDAMSYLWEQTDRGIGGGVGLTANTKVNGPLFRQFGTPAQVVGDDTLEFHSPGQNHAGGSPTRTFPDMAQILAGATNAATGSCPAAAITGAPLGPTLDCYSEFLPTDAYVGSPFSGNAEPSLNFRLTARDLGVDGGGTDHDDVSLAVVRSAGPFQLTSQQASASYAGGSTSSITWDVNGTDIPTLAENVKITLSTDGGQSFNHVLAESTPNDGSHPVTIPQLNTSDARIKIEAVGNIFFDVNDAPITITSVPEVPEVPEVPHVPQVPQVPQVPHVPVDSTPPDTVITSGPRDHSIVLDSRTIFGLGATESPATFDCWLDDRSRACAGGAVTLSGLPSGTHRFSVAARDHASNLDASPASRVFTVPVDDRALTGKGWSRKKASGSFRQTYTQTNKKGAKLTYRVARATSLSLVVGKGKKYGKVTVYLNGAKLRTVSLAGRSASKQVIRLKSFPTGKSGTVKIVSGNGRTVRIDGLAVVSAR